MEYSTARLTITADDVAAWASIALRCIRQRLTTIRQRIPIPAQIVSYNSRLYAAGAARELATAKALLQQDQIRAAGAVAGVALELHLKHVAAAHSISIRHHATIAQMQDRLRYAGLIDTRQRKLIGKLSTTRNLCVHGRKEAPSRAQIARLITGIEELRQTRDAWYEAAGSACAVNHPLVRQWSRSAHGRTQWHALYRWCTLHARGQRRHADG